MKRVVLVAFAFLLAAATVKGEADLILHHGKVVTVDAQFTVAEAVAVSGTDIVSVGSNDEVLKLAGPATQLLDLGGRLLIPGLIDSHTHPADACLTEFDHQIPEMESIADVLAYVRARAAALPEGEWISVQQVFITRLKEKRYPTRSELDAAAPRHPVFFRTGPDAALNSMALQLSGIGRNFRVSDGGSGFAEMDAGTGEPTGVLRNCSRFVKVKSSTKEATAAEQEARLKQLFADYNSVGITTICDRNMSFEALDRYRSLRDRKELTVRLRCSQSVASLGDIQKIEGHIRSVAQMPEHQEESDWLRIIGIKMFLDGGMLTGSAYMREPWGISELYGISDPAYRGVLFIARERLLPMVRTAVQNGLQFTAHSQGDGAVHALLDVYDELSREGLPVKETRCCITHSSFMSPEAIASAARIGVMIDLQPAWLYCDAATLRGHFGLERLRWFIPLQSLFKAGVNVGGGSDHMQKIGSLRSINPYNPFLGMATAIGRRPRGEAAPLHAMEALNRQQALRFYTANNAALLFLEKRTGSLEPGKLADFAVLDTDLLTCPEEQIAQTRAWRTYVGGKLVYSRAETGL